MSARYIISKGIDPVFAVTCGVIAAGVRINREEKEKGRTTQETIDSFWRRWALVTGSGETAGKEKAAPEA